MMNQAMRDALERLNLAVARMGMDDLWTKSPIHDEACAKGWLEIDAAQKQARAALDSSRAEGDPPQGTLHERLHKILEDIERDKGIVLGAYWFQEVNIAVGAAEPPQGEHMESMEEMAKLANFITENFSDQVLPLDSAVDCAIRLLHRRVGEPPQELRQLAGTIADEIHANPYAKSGQWRSAIIHNIVRHVEPWLQKRAGEQAAPGLRAERIKECLERGVDMKVHGADKEFWDEWEQHSRAALTAPVPPRPEHLLGDCESARSGHESPHIEQVDCMGWWPVPSAAPAPVPPSAARMLLSQKCIWDASMDKWREPNAKTYQNLVQIFERTVAAPAPVKDARSNHPLISESTSRMLDEADIATKPVPKDAPTLRERAKSVNSFLRNVSESAFLSWVADRLVYINGDHPSSDFIVRLRALPRARMPPRCAN